MSYKIIVDSCCDMTAELNERIDVVSIPLTLTLGSQTFTDDDTLDLPDYMQKMQAYDGKIGSACPSPGLYRDAFIGGHTSFVVTLSSSLSGSYASAETGRRLAEEEGADVHVFDSKSASSAEILIALTLRKLINNDMPKNYIISTVENFIKEMKTYFVLDNLDNMIKNGRLGKIKGKIISILGIKPIMGADSEGNIALISHARGQNQIVERLADTIEKSGKSTTGECMVITHCNNLSLAEKLKSLINARYNFSEILVIPTRGLSSMYANDKGIIMSF